MVLQRASRAVRGTTTLALGCWQLSCLARRASAPRQPTNLFVVKCDALGIIFRWSRSFHFSQHIRKAWQRKKESGREPVCVPDVIGALPVWWQNTKKKKYYNGLAWATAKSIECNLSQRTTLRTILRATWSALVRQTGRSPSAQRSRLKRKPKKLDSG